EAGGKIVAVVDKQFPAPGGELTPLEGIPGLAALGQALSEAEGTFQSNATPSTPCCPGGPTLAGAGSPQQLFPDLWQRRGLERLASVDVQLVVADLRWFGYSEQERRLSRAARRLHAIRWRRPVLLAANGGSEWLTPSGTLGEAIDARQPGA